MIFAELQYQHHHDVIHEPLASLLGQHFSHVASGLQGDSWIWIVEDDQKVAVDTFTSMKHQVKSHAASPLLTRVLTVLEREYKVQVFEPPEYEAHEEP